MGKNYEYRITTSTNTIEIKGINIPYDPFYLRAAGFVEKAGKWDFSGTTDELEHALSLLAEAAINA